MAKGRNDGYLGVKPFASTKDLEEDVFEALKNPDSGDMDQLDDFAYEDRVSLYEVHDEGIRHGHRPPDDTSWDPSYS